MTDDNDLVCKGCGAQFDTEEEKEDHECEG